MKSALLWLLLATNAVAGNIAVVGPFSGINDTDSSVTLADGEAQDTLNVEVSRDAQYLKKRMGYLLTDTLTTSTAPVYGSIFFKAPNGDNIRIFAHDRYVSKSVNGTSFVNIITTATPGTKWKFCESAGRVFAFNSVNDTPWSYDGTTITYYPLMPKASLCAITPTRMLLAGTTDYPNRLYFSEAGDYTNFVLGVDPESPSFDDVGLAGEKITSLFATEAEWLIFKSNSFTSYQGSNQFDLVASVVSNKVGMVDPNAIVEEQGVTYFKGSDNNVYAYTSGAMAKLSEKIQGVVDGVSKDTVSQILYTTKGEFDGGTYYNTTGDITAGSVDVISHEFYDTTTSDFSRGLISGSSITASGDEISFNNFPAGYFPNIGAESSTTLNWTQIAGTASSWTYTSTFARYGNIAYELWHGAGMVGTRTKFQILDSGNNVVWSGESTNTTIYSVNMSTFTQNPVKIRFYCEAPLAPTSVTAIESILFTKSTGTIHAFASVLQNSGGNQNGTRFDIYEPVIPTSATYISGVTTTTFPTAAKGWFVYDSSNPMVGAYQTTMFPFVRHSESVSGPFTSWEGATNYSLLPNSTSQWWQYKVDFYNTSSYLPQKIYSSGLLYKATGYWESPEQSLGGFNSWGSFVGGSTTDSAASWTYEMKTSTYAGGTDNATWESVTPNVNISVSTGSYVKVRAVNSFTTATDTVRLNEIGYNYTFQTDKQATAFEYLGDIYFSLPWNNSTTNNRTLKLDTKTNGWNVFDIPLNSPIVLDNYVYFGSPTSGHIYQYPVGDNDNGSAINSYWKTKNYLGDNAYVEKNFDRLSLVAGSDYGSTLDITYTMDTATSTSYSISLTSSTADFVRNNRQLPVGEIGQFFNLQIGNNAANQPWSFYGASVEYTNNPWRVLPEE